MTRLLSLILFFSFLGFINLPGMPILHSEPIPLPQITTHDFMELLRLKSAEIPELKDLWAENGNEEVFLVGGIARGLMVWILKELRSFTKSQVLRIPTPSLYNLRLSYPSDIDLQGPESIINELKKDQKWKAFEFNTDEFHKKSVIHGGATIEKVRINPYGVEDPLDAISHLIEKGELEFKPWPKGFANEGNSYLDGNTQIALALRFLKIEQEFGNIQGEEDYARASQKSLEAIQKLPEIEESLNPDNKTRHIDWNYKRNYSVEKRTNYLIKRGLARLFRTSDDSVILTFRSLQKSGLLSFLAKKRYTISGMSPQRLLHVADQLRSEGFSEEDIRHIDEIFSFEQPSWHRTFLAIALNGAASENQPPQIIPEILNLKDGSDLPKNIYSNYSVNDVAEAVVSRLHYQYFSHYLSRPYRVTRASMMLDTDLLIFLDIEKLDDVMKNGYLNYHQTGHSKSTTTGNERVKSEETIMGLKLDLSDERNRRLLPKYAMIQFNSEKQLTKFSTDLRKSFGKAIAVLKPHVKRRAIFSMGRHRGLSYIKNTKRNLMNTRFRFQGSFFQNRIPWFSSDRDLWEAIIYGDISPSDIDYLMIDDSASKSDIEKLIATGLPVYQVAENRFFSSTLNRFHLDRTIMLSPGKDDRSENIAKSKLVPIPAKTLDDLQNRQLQGGEGLEAKILKILDETTVEGATRFKISLLPEVRSFSDFLALSETYFERASSEFHIANDKFILASLQRISFLHDNLTVSELHEIDQNLYLVESSRELFNKWMKPRIKNSADYVLAVMSPRDFVLSPDALAERRSRINLKTFLSLNPTIEEIRKLQFFVNNIPLFLELLRHGISRIRSGDDLLELIGNGPTDAKKPREDEMAFIRQIADILYQNRTLIEKVGMTTDDYDKMTKFIPYKNKFYDYIQPRLLKPCSQALINGLPKPD